MRRVGPFVVLLLFTVRMMCLSQDSLYSTPVNLTLRTLVEIRLDILACSLSSKSLQAPDMGPIFCPVKIELRGDHYLFAIFGKPDRSLTKERQVLLVQETMDLISSYIESMMRKEFPAVHFDARRDLTGECYADVADPVPNARWKAGSIEWMR